MNNKDYKINAEIAALIDNFCVYHIDERNHSAVTAKYYRRHLRNLFKVLEQDVLKKGHDYNISDISKTHMKQLSLQLRKNGNAVSSRVTLHNVLKSFYKWLIEEEGQITENTSSFLPKLKSRKARVKSPDIEDYNFVIDFIEKKMDFRYSLDKENTLFFFKLMFAMMARISEMPPLKVKDINIKRNIVFIREGKGGKDRFVVIPPEASKIVESFIEKNELKPDDNIILGRGSRGEKLTPMGERGLSHRVQAILKEIKAKTGRDLTWMTSHKLLRKCPATEMRRQGVDLVNIQLMLGHENLNTTKLYVGDDLNKLEKKFSINHPLSSSFK